MYQLNDEQIDFIHNDIRARGVVTESLQLNLLDHICCIIELELEENGDFGLFYPVVVRRFFKESLAELEEETHLLLNSKTYLAMKRTMLLSGAFSAFTLTAGIIFKYLHMPGAAICITLGIGITCLVFIPLVFTLKLREKQAAKDRLLLGLSFFTGALMAMAILFKIQHWPGANVMGVTAPILLACVYLPIYFFSGIRNPDTKVNTAVTSVLILVGCGLFFSLTLTPRASHLLNVVNTNRYLRMERLLQNEANLSNWQAVKKGAASEIYGYCEELKASMLDFSAGAQKLDGDFEAKGNVIQDAGMYDYVTSSTANASKLQLLSKAVNAYNSNVAANPTKGVVAIPANSSLLSQEKTLERVYNAIEDLEQIQMQLLQNERAMAQQETVATVQ